MLSLIRKSVNVATCIILVFITINCNRTKAHNPFDNDFSISIKEFISNGCDTISAGCGYFNLQEKAGDFRIYYQIYDENNDEVLAKGFTYYLDTFKMERPKHPNEAIFDSISNLPIKIDSLIIELAKFNYSVLDTNKNVISVTNIEILDTIYLDFVSEISFTENELIVVRRMTHYKSKIQIVK